MRPIQRFEYTFEVRLENGGSFPERWKALWQIPPKSAIRASWQAGLLDEKTAETALQMSDARNMTVHIYNEELAISIYDQSQEICRCA